MLSVQERVIVPVGGDIRTSVGIVIPPVSVAYGSQRGNLHERVLLIAAQHKIEDIPKQIAGPQAVPGVCLAVS